MRVGALASIALFVLMLFRMTFLLRRNQQQANVLQHMIRTDPLTGAANRRWLTERLDLEIARARRTGNPLTVAYMDLDHFKQYNDHHGHAAGDELLRTMVARWQNQLRDTDLLARIGGEEFVLVCPDTPIDACVKVMERLRSVVPDGQHALPGGRTFGTPILATPCCKGPMTACTRPNARGGIGSWFGSGAKCF